ncbi:MAG: FliH/SctL family protein [Phycisphaeraceae bacterium]
MPVLKQHNNTPAMREAIVLDLGDIGAQAARIRAAAESKAAQIISDAQAKAEAIAKQRGEEAEELGYQAGLAKGLTEGQEQGRAEALKASAEQLQQLVAAWSQVAGDWEQQRGDMEREARQAVLDFALSATEKIVHRVIEVDETVVVDQAAQALSLVLSAHDASVRIHPVDRPLLEEAMPQLLTELAGMEHIDLVDDEAITPGGCVVAFGQGKIDATIERQLQRLVNLILPEPPAVEIEEPSAGEAEAISESPGEVPTPPAPVYEITDQGLVESSRDTSIEEVTIDDVPEAESMPEQDEPPKDEA